MTISDHSLFRPPDVALPHAALHEQSKGQALEPRLIRRVPVFLFVILAGFYFFVLALPLGGVALLSDPDVYWHVSGGRTIWQTGSLPHFDELSHTFQGQPWIAKEWLGQLILAAAYAVAGWRTVVMLAAGVIALTYGLLFLTLARKMRITVALGVAIAVWAFSAGHYNARPQIFADPLIILWVAGLVRAVETRSPPSFWLLPIMTLWANVHASFTFGLAIAAVFAAESFFGAAAGERRLVARRWAVFLAAALASACITPYGYRPILMTFQVFVGNDALNFVQEWSPATVQSFGVGGLALLALPFMGLYFGVKLPFWRLVLIFGLAALMFAHIRFAALFALVTPLPLADPLVRQFPFLGLPAQIAAEPQFFRTIGRASQRFLYPAIALIAAGAVAFAAYGPAVSPKANITPEGAVDTILREHLMGNVYNDFDFGGYLIFRGVKTFIDGRNDQLFTHGFVTRLHDVIDRHPGGLEAYLDQYEISVVLVGPGSPEDEQLENSTNWRKVYSDAVSVLFRKQSP